MNRSYNWSEGDSYYIIRPNGNRLWGTIQTIDEDGYHVEWDDGTTTVEDEPDPASSWWENYEEINN